LLESLSQLFNAFNESNSVVNKYLIVIYFTLIIYLILLHILKKKIIDSRHCAFLSYHLWAVPILTLGIMIYNIFEKTTIIMKINEMYTGLLVHFIMLECLICISFIEWWRKNVRPKTF
jgi:hypothetical protein